MIGPVLVTGASGQVGSAMVRLLSGAVPVVAPNRAEMDLLNPASIREYVAKVQPRWIVSCGAYTAVDAAETDREAAFVANGVAPGLLAEAAADAGAGFIHFSTDYVFDGSGERPWVETDATGPRNVYGASKLAGEQAIATVAARSSLPHIVLRTSWVYSGGGKNFVRTMLRLLSTKSEALRIVGDQHGSPTAAADLAEAVATILRSGQDGGSPAEILEGRSGIYHCAGTSETTWAGLAEAVRDELRSRYGMTPPPIVPVPSSEYPTPAARPLNSRLDCGKLESVFAIRLPNWRLSLAAAVQELAATDLEATDLKVAATH